MSLNLRKINLPKQPKLTNISSIIGPLHIYHVGGSFYLYSGPEMASNLRKALDV